MDLISLVVPCYNEEKAIPCFFNEILSIKTRMLEVEFELIFVNDGSHDNTLKELKKLADMYDFVKYISFSKNFGKEAAIYAGLQHAKGEYVAIMDADLQDPPELLKDMYNLIIEEGYESVATRRVSRKGEPPIRSFCARMFYKIMNKVSNADIVDGARDYRLMSRKFVNAVLSMGEYNRFSKGLFGWLGFKTKWIEFENVERVAGETKWSFWKLLLYSVEGIVAFSTMPLVLSSLFGVVSCVLAFVFLIFIVVRKICWGDPVDGWASMVSIILFTGGIQLFCIGILGQYLAKTYLETKKRPIYILDETNISETEEKNV